MPEDPARWYSSKIDWWIIPLLLVPPTAALLLVGRAFQTGNWTDGLIGLLTLFLVLAIYLGLIFPMRYGITRDRLIVRAGFTRQEVPLEQIVEVRRTYNPLSSPALSLDRLRITTTGRLFNMVLISPAHQTKFVNELAAAANLHRREDNRGWKLVREADCDPTDA